MISGLVSGSVASVDRDLWSVMAVWTYCTLPGVLQPCTWVLAGGKRVRDLNTIEIW